MNTDGKISYLNSNLKLLSIGVTAYKSFIVNVFACNLPIN